MSVLIEILLIPPELIQKLANSIGYSTGSAVRELFSVWGGNMRYVVGAICYLILISVGAEGAKAAVKGKTETDKPE